MRRFFVQDSVLRSPFLTDMSAIDLDELSGGRLLLGVGSGNRHIRQIVRAHVGSTVTYEGKVHSMHWTPAVNPVRESIPVYLSAIYPKMVRVAGRVADGLALGALLSTTYIREVIQPAARAAAAAAGRDPPRLGFLLAAFVSVDTDRERARQAARAAICRLFSPLPHPYYEFLLRKQGFSAAADAALKYVPAGNLAKAAEAMSDDLIDALTIAGTPAECRARIAEYGSLVDEVLYVNVASAAATDPDPLAAYRHVLRLPQMSRPDTSHT